MRSLGGVSPSPVGGVSRKIMMVMVLRRESRGGGTASGGTITTFHGKDKQFLSLVSSGDKIMEMDCTGFQKVKSIGLNAQVKVDPGWEDAVQVPQVDHHHGPHARAADLPTAGPTFSCVTASHQSSPSHKSGRLTSRDAEKLNQPHGSSKQRGWCLNSS